MDKFCSQGDVRVELLALAWEWLFHYCLDCCSFKVSISIERYRLCQPGWRKGWCTNIGFGMTTVLDVFSCSEKCIFYVSPSLFFAYGQRLCAKILRILEYSILSSGWSDDLRCKVLEESVQVYKDQYQRINGAVSLRYPRNNIHNPSAQTTSHHR